MFAKLTKCLLGFFVTLMLAGCHGDSTAPAATGRAAITIIWKLDLTRAKTRLIPEATNSMVVSIKSGGTVLATQTIARPAGTTTTTTLFSDLPTHNLTLEASAYSSSNGTGAALALGSVPITVVASQTTTVNLTLVSSVSSLVVNYTAPTILVGDTVAFTATGRDAGNNVILLTPSKLTWVSSNTGRITTSATSTGANVAGAGAGSATVTLTDTESGVTLPISLTGMSFSLTPATPTISITDPQTFTATIAGPSDTSVTWSVVGGSGNGSITSGGIYTAPAAPGSYTVRATSNADATKYRSATLTVQSGHISAVIN